MTANRISAGFAATLATTMAAWAAPQMAPIAQYRIADRAAEIALARTAAPPSVSDAAAVMVLGPKGYVPAAPGSNGFVCLVQRAWFSGLADDGFWNPKLRAPICYNRQAARSVLPAFLKRTAWAMAGASQAEIRQRIRAAMAAGRYPPAEAGAITYMMSKEGYLGDGPHGPWRPHLMFYMPPMPSAVWGADLPGTGVYSTEAGIDPYTMFYIPVGAWSDGTPYVAAAAKPMM
jgi:hypothetical protein